MIPKLNIGATLGAFVLFFLPWLDIQCGDKSFATQTGMQTIYGGSSVSKEMKAFSENPGYQSRSSKKDESLGVAVLVIFAFVLVMAAVIASFLVFMGRNQTPQNLVGTFCALALVALVIQLMIDFPVKGQLAGGMAKADKSQKSTGPLDNGGAEMAAAMALSVQVRYMPAFYFELVALGFPTLLLLNSLLDKLKKDSTGKA